MAAVKLRKPWSKEEFRQLAEEGKWVNPNPPWGFDLAPDRRLVKNPFELGILREMVEMYAQTKSLDHVAFELRKRGISTKVGGVWSARGVRGILTNELYTGKFRAAGVELHIEEYRVLDDDTFAQIQDTLHRFEGRGHKRPQMQVDRKKAKIDKIFGQYFAKLEEEG
ncbi:hypothetical protein ES703_41655 [subsurface metagenome]